jgi:curved DNA-binding protein CbpA
MQESNKETDKDLKTSAHVDMVAYEDPEVKVCKQELKALEEKIQDLDALKNEQLASIEDFNTQYSLFVGDLIEKILKRKEEILAVKIAKLLERFEQEKECYEETKRKTKKLKAELEALDECDDAYDKVHEAWEVAKEVEEAQRKKVEEAKEALENDEDFKAHEEIKQEHEESSCGHKKALEQKRFTLNDEEKKELKLLFRKAARLCHPDIVTKELQDKAHEITAQLNEAYGQNDLNSVKKILDMLENGVYFDAASDSLQDVEKLKYKIVHLTELFADISQELEDIRADETYQTIEEIENWDDYFDEVRKALESEYEALR